MALAVEDVAYMAHLGGLAFGLLAGWLGYGPPQRPFS
ncbi:MAG: rhomboid family intramembrane serine protease [Bacillota bacterium]|nr:rhomboid family intramembrane serine protease [Bacillota bacterium]